MSDFNKILYQQCNVKLQTNRKISVKSANNCNSYSGFSAGTQKNEVSTIGNGRGSWLLNCVSEEILNNMTA